MAAETLGLLPLRHDAARPGTFSSIRVIDPTVTPVTRTVVPGRIPPSLLDAPGPAALMRLMETRADLYLVQPISTAANSVPGVSSMDEAPGIVVVGRDPSFLPSAESSAPSIWGSLVAHYPGVDIDDGHLGALPLVQQAATAPTVRYHDGRGRAFTTKGEAILHLAPATAADVGLRPTTPSVPSLMLGLVCECRTSALESVAQTMNDAERAAGTPRRYFAQDVSDAWSVVDRFADKSSLATSEAAALALAGLALLATGATGVMWRRNGPTYRAERALGVPLSQFIARQQVLLAGACTVPLLGGYGFYAAISAQVDWPPPLPEPGWFVAVAMAASIHLVAGTMQRQWSRELDDEVNGATDD